MSKLPEQMGADSSQEPPVRRRGLGDTPRWVKFALFGSLAANLLVLGLAAGTIWHARTVHAVGGGNLHGNLVAFSQTLSAPRRAELGVLINEPRQQPEHQAQRQDVRAARREVMRLFRADPFDAAAFRAAELRAGTAETRIRDFADAQAAALASQLTTAERLAFLKWRELRRGRWRFEPDGERPAKSAPPKSQ
jgi:uncharacterized membrane protein